MRPELLAAVQARIEAVLSDPWAIYEDPDFGGVVSYPANATDATDFDVVCGGAPHEGYLEAEHPDTIFIAHAPTDVRLLLAEVKRLHAILGSFALDERLL